MNMTSRKIFPRTKKNPMRVTMFGASHMGRILTKAFHYAYPVSHIIVGKVT
jgi:hypothetical protein